MRPPNTIVASVERGEPPFGVQAMQAPGIEPTPAPVEMAPTPAPKRYRVLDIPMEGRVYKERSLRTARMVPNKILDERYFDIAFLRAQGFSLEEVTDGARQIDRYGR